MKIELKVIASSSIKRRKPWPRIVWMGSSLLMLDKSRVSILYLPSGKTRRKIAQLSSVVTRAVCLTSTPSGGDLIGLLDNGDVFLWNKNSEQLRTVCGLASSLGNLHLSSGTCQVFASDDCNKILVTVQHKHLFLWQHDTNHTYLAGKDHTLLGLWTRVIAPAGIALPTADSQEACLQALFVSNSVLGVCCDVSVVFNSDAIISVCSLLIRFALPIPTDQKYASFHYHWKCMKYPLHNISRGCEAISIKGAYILRYSNDGNMLAVAVNQKSPADTRMLFLSPITDMLLMSSLRGCGIRQPETKRGKAYWIADLAWSYDNLFVACMFCNGSVALLPRLGEPVVIVTSGCSMELGPAYFLPVHPVMSIQAAEDQHRQRPDDTELELSSAEDVESWQQVFSVSSHPSQAVFLFSDGFMVTIAQLPSELNTFTFMWNLVLESSKYLKRIGESQHIELTVVNAYNLPVVEERVKSSPRQPSVRGPEKKHFSFEELDISLNETVDSEVSAALGLSPAHADNSGAIHNVSRGKIVFGEPDILQTILDSTDPSKQEDSLMKDVVLAKHNMLLVWKLAASTTEPWIVKADDIIKRLVDNLVKLFVVILDCPPVVQALEQQQQNHPTAVVQTASLYQVISIYRHLLEVAQFDALQKRLAQAVLRLAHATLTTVLDSSALQTTDPRLKTLSGCFTLLKFTEKTLNNLYVLLPKSVQSRNHKTVGDVFEPLPSALPDEPGGSDRADREDKGLAFDADQLLTKRLSGSWQTLYKAVLSYQQGALSDLNNKHAQQLLLLIQQTLAAIKAPVPHNPNLPISTGDKLSLDGKHTLAMNAWKEQLKRFKDTGSDGHAGKLLHSLLYTHLMRVDLLSAVQLIDSLVLHADVQSAVDSNSLTRTPPIQPSFLTFVTNTMKSQALREPDMVPCIRDKAIRQVVQTLARFMVAYFSNQTVYIFPPHNAQPLPALHIQSNIQNRRIIPKYHEEISSMVRRQKLSSIWTVERALEYLLLSGLLCEATWFADQMGNWKTAFQLAAAYSLHRAIAPTLYQKPQRPLILPDDLAPEEILYDKLAKLVIPPTASDLQGPVLIDENTNMDQLCSTLEDIMIAGVMVQVEVAPRLFTLLVSRLKVVVKQLQPLVTADFYLPAPPLYCPQPSPSLKAEMTAEVKNEWSLRQQSASLIQLTLAVMNAAHISVPSVCWYSHRLADAQAKARQFKTSLESPCQNFPSFLLEQLNSRSIFEQVRGDTSIYAVLGSFRDFCSLLWMLHARDNLTQNLRKREKFFGHLEYDKQRKSQGDASSQSEWLSLCRVALQWAAHLMPFTHFLSEEASVHKVVVSMLLELDPSTHVADLMAEFFHDSENIHPELQERLDKVLANWQRIIVRPEEDGRSVRDSVDGRKSVTFQGASPRGESLSVYFIKQQQAARKMLKKKQQCFGHYEEYVFAPGLEPPKKLLVGARPFETKTSFCDFLEIFCSISFSKVLDNRRSQDRISTLPLINSLCVDLMNKEMNFFLDNVASLAHKKQDLQNMIAAGKQGIQPVGLFRGFADCSPERHHAVVTGGTADLPAGIESPSPRQQGVREACHSWQLTVNFGQRYTRLQQLLQWLEVWSNKSHKFGLGQRETLLELKPSVKLQIPAQLIVLSLWLLENKYCKTSSRTTNMERGRQNTQSQRSQSASLSPLGSGTSDRDQTRSVPVWPVGQEYKQQKNQEVTGPHSMLTDTQQQEDQEVTGPHSMLTDTQQIRTAYEEVLDRPDDSSSLVVSSLASDDLPSDLQHSNNVLCSASPGSVLNHTVYLPRDQSPFDRPQNPSPAAASGSPSTRGKSSAHRSASTSPVHTPPVSSPKYKKQQRSAAIVNNDAVVVTKEEEGILTHVLQKVIRIEMKRIVQIQQQSLTAMMGAIDSRDMPDFNPLVNYNQSGLYPPKDRQSPGKQQDSGVRHALAELHDLQQQQQVAPGQAGPSFHQQVKVNKDVMSRMSPGPFHLSHLASNPYRSEGQENQPPGMHPSPAEEFRLPVILPPQQAWGPERQLAREERTYFPLLRLPTEYSHYEPAMYVPINQAAGFVFAPPSTSFQPPPPSHQRVEAHPLPLSFQHIPSQVSAPQQDSLDSSGCEGLIGIPLLRLQPIGFPTTSQEPLFGRLVPPEYLSAQMKEKERQEESKQRLLQEFHRQLAAQQTEAEPEQEEEPSQELKARPAKGAAAKSKTIKSRKPTPMPSSPYSTGRDEPQSDQAEAESVQSAKQHISENELQEEQSAIHDGYAIPPGMFEGYENLEKDPGVEADSNARFQYKAAQAMRQQLEREKDRWLQQRRIELTSNTRSKTDAAVDVQQSLESCIPKESGVNPVQDVVTESNRSLRRVPLPPDIFLALQFADGQEISDNVATSDKTRRHVFLNVADIPASLILQDSPEHEETNADAARVVKPSSYLIRNTSAQRMDEFEESLRAQYEPVQQKHHDDVTVHLFEHVGSDDHRMSVALLPRASQQHSKTALVQKLKAMSDQMSAIDEISRNVDNEFHNSRMLLQTIQTMNDSYQATSAANRYQDQEEDGGRASEETFVPKRSGGSPTYSTRSSKTGRVTSPSQQSRKSGSSPRHEASRTSNLSGLSDISDIIGEVLADGGVDLKAAGLTEEEAAMYTARAKIKRKTGSPLTSYEELKTCIMDAEYQAKMSSPEMERRQIQQWMSEKYAERHSEYLKQRQNLQQREHNPYKPPSHNPKGTQDLSKWEKTRELRRQERERENMERRILEAEYLIGSAITDAVETKRELSRSRSPSPKSRSMSSSPVRSGHHKSKSSSGRFPVSTRPQPSSQQSGHAPLPSYTTPLPSHTTPLPSNTTPLPSNTKPFPSHVTPVTAMDQTFSITPPPKGILKPTQSTSDIRQPVLVQPSEVSSDFAMTGESGSDLRDYLSAIQDIEMSAIQDIESNSNKAVTPPVKKDMFQPTQLKPVTEEPQKVIKPKLIVRPQRPHITRQSRWTKQPDEKFVQQALAEKAARQAAKSVVASSAQRTQSSQAEDRARKAYAPIPKLLIARRVKTYSERLKELKPVRHFAGPIIPRQHVMDSVLPKRSITSAPPGGRRPPGPAHRPMTYVQQLKNINKSAALNRHPGRPRGPPTPVRTIMASRTAPHKPKTYTQQLQELNAPFKKTFRSSARGPSSLTSSRLRPYGDPYSDDLDSVLSDWTVDEDIRKLLYDSDSYGGTTVDGIEASISIDQLIFSRPSSVDQQTYSRPAAEDSGSDYLDMVMGGDFAQTESGADYRESVDLSELERIAEAFSIGSSSITSVLDWDAIDQLTKGVE